MNSERLQVAETLGDVNYWGCTVENGYELKIDYKQNSSNPESVFESMATMIKTMRNFDEMMIESLPNIVKVEIQLEAIEVGSIKAKLRTILELVPDTAIENLEWKNLVGSYLVKAKHYTIEKMSDKDTLTNKEEVNEIKNGIERIAYDELGEKTIISKSKLLTNLCDLSDTMKQLDAEDKVIYISGKGSAVLNRNFDLKMSQIEDLISSETEEINTNSIVQIKKPDYLGSSKWEFYYDGHSIDAKIKDLEWLGKYQDGKIDIRPKDALKISLKTKFSRDEYGQIFHTYYEVTKVREVIKAKDYEQIKFNN